MTHRRCNMQRGRSLVAWLVGIGLGLLVTAAGWQLADLTRTALHQQSAATRLSNEGVLALELLASQLRQAGYSAPRRMAARGLNGRPHQSASLRACDGGFVDPLESQHEALRCLSAPGARQAALAVRFEADADNSWTGAQGRPTDCRGTQVNPRESALGSYTLVENRYFIRSHPTTGQPTLYCAGNGGASFASQPLFENVEEFVIEWSLPEASQPASLPRWLSSDALDQALQEDPGRWSRPAVARLCLLLRSGPGAAEHALPYRGCDGQERWAADRAQRRLRQTFTATLRLPNLGTPP
jgi:hypothetical protein